MSRTFYTADLHFGHNSIIQKCNRPFTTADEMDEAMILLWNGRVRPEDTVYVAGDFCYKAKCKPEEYPRRLNGHKILVRGNHDNWIEANPTAAGMFDNITNLMHTFDPSCGGRHVSVCHYPLMIWPGKDSYMVYGHIHNDTDLPFWPFISNQERMLNAAVEVNHYMPVTLEELIRNNSDFRKTNEAKEDIRER
mgnify:CR=1 FL=1